jgi:hypothetical protein
MEITSKFNSKSLLCRSRRIYQEDEHTLSDDVDRESEIECMTFSDVYWNWFDDTCYHNIFCEAIDRSRGLSTTRDLFFFSSIQPKYLELKRKTSKLDNPLISSRKGEYMDGKIYVHNDEYYDEFSERVYRQEIREHFQKYLFLERRN